MSRVNAELRNASECASDRVGRGHPEDLGPHPNPHKAADGKRLHGLTPDPQTAPVVQRIFRDLLNDNGIFAIAETLTNEGVPSPSAHDRKRNPHRDGRAWAKSAVRVILTNPRYTGRQVWNKQRTDEVLVDVDDVALGHQPIQPFQQEQCRVQLGQALRGSGVTGHAASPPAAEAYAQLSIESSAAGGHITKRPCAGSAASSTRLPGANPHRAHHGRHLKKA